MRAVTISEPGSPDVLRWTEVPDPVCGPGEVVVDVAATAVNRADLMQRQGFYPPPPGASEILGLECSGVISEVGEGVEHLAVGDLAMGIVVPIGPHGAYREDKALSANSVVRAPKGATAVEACTLPMNGLTARMALDRMALQPGQVLAVTGSAGAFGGFVVQLAKADGLTVVADASEADEQLVRDLGADLVVRRGDDVAARIRLHYPDGVDGLADGAVPAQLVLPAVKAGGVMATVRGYKGDGERGVQGLPCQVARAAEDRAGLDRLRQQAEDGVVTLRVARTFPAEQAADAHRLLEAGGVRGRIVLTF